MYKQTNQSNQTNQTNQTNQSINSDIYIPTMVTQTVVLPFDAIGRNVKHVLEQHLVHAHEGKCNAEGYVRPRSTQLIAHSSGTLTDRGAVAFEVMYEYQACNPVEGMLIKFKRLRTRGFTRTLCRNPVRWSFLFRATITIPTRSSPNSRCRTRSRCASLAGTLS